MKKVLMMIAASLVMTSSAFAIGPAAGCPLKNLNKSISRNDQSTNFYYSKTAKTASRNESFSGKSGAQQ